MSEPPGTTKGVASQGREGKRYRTWLLRVVAACRWVIVGVVLIGLLTNILLFPLAKGFDGWGQGVLDQVAALLALRETHPVLGSLGVAIVLCLIVAGFLAERALKQKEQRKQETQQRRIAHEEAIKVADRLNQAAPPVPREVIAPTGLPRPASLVGREQELQQLMEGLRAGESVGIFALAGMGGVGKTAIAAEAVAQLSEEREVFPGGAAWIPCDELRGEEGLADLWTRVARVLRLEQVSALADPQERRVALGAALAQRQRLLLALDNIEPGQEAKPGLDAEAVLETLAVRGHTAVLLTSRQGIAPHRLTAISVAPLEALDARTLLVQRLRQIDPTRPTAQEELAIPKLVEVVGGLPLAIELTAAYAGVQRRSLEVVLHEIEEEGVQAGALRGDARRGLLQSFERSWKALTARQQRLLAGLSLLAGASFPREAALALAQATVAKVVTDAEGDLATLVSFALVEPLAGERLRLHPLLREYAEGKLAKLPEEQQERLGEAMVAYWLAYAEGHPSYDGMDALEAEALGLLGALEWVHVHARYKELLALAEALAIAWYVRGRRAEGLSISAWAAQAAEALGDPKQQRWAAHYLAVTLAAVGRLEEARAGYERALELARQVGDLGAELAEVHDLAELDRMLGRLEVARIGFHRTLELAQQLHDPAAERLALHQTALLDAQTGRLLEARAGYERALALAQQADDLVAEQRELHALAALDFRAGQLSKARTGVERALELAQQMGDLAAEQLAVHDLAVLNGQTGRLSEARAGHERSLDLARQLGAPSAESVELANFGLFLCKHGEVARGHELVKQSLAISERLNNVYHIGKGHQYLAWIEEQQGNRTEAIAHLREVLRRYEQVQSPEAEGVRAELRELSEEG